ncbi:MAG TPA: response regulator transcription factor [Nitrolancea sp.]|jgi:two-component system KDP operon response regulator KdpE|nr:response regulator transcription factor [Nitrolancea sp.]
MAMRKQLVLVADDDAPILRLVRTKLQADGYGVITAANGQEAVELVERERPDVVVLDIMMPVMDGMEAMQRIRESSSVPIILLTARSGPTDKIRGLDSGADDYVTKPFNPDELAARVAAILRRSRSEQAPAQQQRLTYGDLNIDLALRQVTLRGDEVRLTRTEWELLYLLASNAGRVMTHGELLSRIWGPEFRDETYYLRTWVSRLRGKLDDAGSEESLIVTYPGLGYRLRPPEGTDS